MHGINSWRKCLFLEQQIGSTDRAFYLITEYKTVPQSAFKMGISASRR